MNVFTGIKRAGVIGKSIGYIGWGVKEVFKLSNSVAKKGYNAVTQRRQYKIHLEIVDPKTGAYTTHSVEERLTSTEALNLMDSMDYFNYISVRVTKEKK